jgi:SAM-dependent methyltransferase
MSTTPTDPRLQRIRELQAESAQRGDAYHWFESVYTEAGGEPARIPWSQDGLNPHLRNWARHRNGAGKSAAVIGCGLGENAEYLATLGFAVTAFDISRTAVEWCRQRYPASGVRYLEGDLFAPEKLGTFDLAVEIHTLQALPRELRQRAIAAVAALTGQQLLVICRGCDQPEPDETIPWPLTREELAEFGRHGLDELMFHSFTDEKQPPVRRFLIEYRRKYTKT